MFTKNIKTMPGSEAQYDPRPIGEILQEYFSTSNEPLAVAYRKRKEMENVEQLNSDSDGKK